MIQKPLNTYRLYKRMTEEQNKFGLQFKTKQIGIMFVHVHIVESLEIHIPMEH